MKFTNKEFVKSFEWCDLPAVREHFTSERINGRVYVKCGRHTATTFVGNLYKLCTPSNEPNKYVLLVGIAKQHPDDINPKKSVGVELAAYRSYAEPDIILYLDDPIKQQEFNMICDTVRLISPKQFIRTEAEKALKNGPTDGCSCSCYNCCDCTEHTDDEKLEILEYAEKIYG